MVNVADALKMLGQRAPRSPGEAERKARDLVRLGLPAAVIEHLAAAFGTSVDEIQRIIGVSRATGTRRRVSRAALRPSPSDRALRMAGVFSMAKHVFEDAENAREWFKEPNRELHGERPLDLLDTDVGAQSVVRVLHRIEYGVYS